MTVPRGRLFRFCIDDARDVAADAAQIAALNGAEDIDNAVDIVVGHHGHAVRARDGC